MYAMTAAGGRHRSERIFAPVCTVGTYRSCERGKFTRASPAGFERTGETNHVALFTSIVRYGFGDQVLILERT
jgi:hypothetical protein